MMDAETKLSCDKCQFTGFDLVECIFKNGTKHVKALCGLCGTYKQFVPQSEPVEHLNPALGDKNPIYPFGRYRGLRPSEMPKDYTRWAARNIKDPRWKAVFEEHAK